ncbi:MAG: cobalt-precorrin-5B (C(1))-methyltransferase CbiD, partial [Gammaproteobacteria bacterium]|nr:cobalt-precorrin-5B (C(1))-methyltransferase CbiD [Gammaproteobacteria bacterium]
MWPESAESPAPLRTGLTTGTCATACCVAAAQALFAQQQEASVSVTLPKGKVVDLPIIEYQKIDGGIKTATIKDAGDDPDATHGATLFVELRLSPEQGVRFHAAQGVGTVTRTGLLLDVGEPAINPVPRKMMTEHLEGFAKTYQYLGGFDVSVGVINGEQIAQKTMNPRLGILGGLSILG